MCSLEVEYIGWKAYGRDAARRAGRLEDHLREAVGGARRHRAGLARGQVVDHDLEAGRRVVHVDDQLVARSS